MPTARKEEEGLDLSGGKPDGEEPTSKRGRPSNTAKAGELKKRIAQTISEAAAWCEKLGDEELAEILTEDGPKMAAWLAYHAEKRARLAKALTRLFGEGSAFDFGQAFGRLLRALQTRIGATLPRPGGEAPAEEPEQPEPEPLGGVG